MCGETSEEERKKMAEQDNDPAFKERVKQVEKELEERYSKLRASQEATIIEEVKEFQPQIIKDYIEEIIAISNAIEYKK